MDFSITEVVGKILLQF